MDERREWERKYQLQMDLFMTHKAEWEKAARAHKHDMEKRHARQMLACIQRMQRLIQRAPSGVRTPPLPKHPGGD